MTKDEILSRLLSDISDEFDKDVGSFFYDVTKPAAEEFETSYARLEKILKNGFPLDKKEFININFPSAKDEFKGLKVAHTGKRVYNYKAYANKNPRGVEYFWLAAAGLEYERQANSDIDLLLQGYAVMTPIMLDLTAYNKLETLKKWAKI